MYLWIPKKLGLVGNPLFQPPKRSWPPPPGRPDRVGEPRIKIQLSEMAKVRWGPWRNCFGSNEDWRTSVDGVGGFNRFWWPSPWLVRMERGSGGRPLLTIFKRSREVARDLVHHTSPHGWMPRGSWHCFVDLLEWISVCWTRGPRGKSTCHKGLNQTDGRHRVYSIQ